MVQTLPQKTAGLYVQDQPLAFPLKHTDVKAQISGNLSRVEVTHSFENPFTTALEATYVFPLPDEAAVDTMTIRLGDRTIQGRIEKREDAQAIYERAKQKGQTAGLLEQERANIFTQSLANILPGEPIEVVITYSDQLPYKQGAYEFVFPMVVGPRYIPGNPIAEADTTHGSAAAPMTLNQDTDLVPDASRLNGPIIPSDMRSDHDIQVTVQIETETGQCPCDRTKLQSPSHQIVVDTTENLTRITLAPGDTIPNKDLILRYQVATETTQTSLLTQSDERGGHFAVYMIPALAYDTDAYIPKDMVFLIDTSGSQSGAPLAQCQALMRRFIEGLHPQDTFNIVNFANTTQQLSQVPLGNTSRNRQQALNYVDRLRAGGGTEMLRGLKTVLNLPQPNSERIRNIVLLTDGYIGNETQIFAEVQQSLGLATRLHSFGAGSSVNRFLLNRVAEMGRGISQVVRHDEGIDRIVDKFFGQINNPVLGNLSAHWEGAGEAPSLYPMAVPDVFAEQPLMLFGRKTDKQPGTLHLSGIAAGGNPFKQSLAVAFDSAGNPAIAQLWGRSRIKELMNQMVSGETTHGVQAVTETALAYQLLSQYTAFVAVSEESRVAHLNNSISVNVPVTMPEAVSYAGVFGTVAVAQPIRSRARPGSAAPKGRHVTLFSKQAAPPPMPAPSIDAESSADLKADSKADSMYEARYMSPYIADDGDSSDGVADTVDSAPVSASADETVLPGAAPAEVGAGSDSPQQIQVVKAEGLNDAALKQLKHHLQQLQLANPPAGTLIFELVIQRGRVKRVMLDMEASELKDPFVVSQLRRILMAWQCPQIVAKPLRLELRVQP
ncbi:VIT domain-containing protein [Leptothoe sp. LEGE 181152]|nr:VIT domain-containing protein [Leptothoe sp. LEGE 181152]